MPDVMLRCRFSCFVCIYLGSACLSMAYILFLFLLFVASWVMSASAIYCGEILVWNDLLCVELEYGSKGKKGKVEYSS